VAANQIQFGIRIDVDGQTAVADIEKIGAASTATGNQAVQAGQQMAAAFSDSAASTASAAQSAQAWTESEAAATDRIRNMVAASLQQIAVVDNSTSSLDLNAASVRAAADESVNYARAVAAANAQMSQPQTGTAVSSVASEESLKYVASLQRQYDMLGKNAAEIAEYEAALKGGTQAVQAQAAAIAGNAEALREQIAAEQKNGQAADTFIASLKAQTAAIGLNKSELLAMRAAQLGVSEEAAPLIDALGKAGDGAKGAGGHMDGFSLSSNAARREVIVLAHELSQGNFSKFGGSMMVLAESTGAASLLFSAAGLTAAALTVAVAGVGYAAIKGASEQKEMADALILTNDYAGVTSDGLNDLAHAAAASGGSLNEAKKAVTELASSGKFTGDQIGYISEAAVAMEKATGKSIDSTIAQFESLAVQSEGSSARSTDVISRATLKLDDTYHFLTEAVYEQIVALEKEGDAKGASALATETFAKATKDRADEINDNLGTIAKKWNAIKESINGAVDALGDLGKKQTPAIQVASIKKEIASIDNGTYTDSDEGAPAAYSQEYLAKVRAADVTALAAAQADLNKVNDAAAQKSAAAMAQSKAAHSASEIAADDLKIQKKGLSELQIALDKYYENVNNIKAVNPDSPLVTDQAISDHVAALTKAHTDTSGTDDRSKVLQDALLQEQTALDSSKAIFDARDKMLTLYHTKFATSDDEYFAGRKAARDEYSAAEAQTYAKEMSLVAASLAQAKNPSEVAAAKEKADQLVKVHQDFVQKMSAAGGDDSALQSANAQKTYDDYIDSIDKGGQAIVKSLDDQISKETEHGAEIGKTKAQVDALKKAQEDAATADLKNQKAAIENLLKQDDLNEAARGIYTDVLSQINAQIAARQQLATVLGSNAVAQANADASKAASAAWDSTAKHVEETLADAIANGGANAWKKLKTTLVSQALNIPINFVGTLAASILNPTAPQSSAAASASGSIGSLINAVNTAKSAYTAITATGSGSIGAWLAGSTSVAPTSVLAANVAGATGGDAIGTLASLEGWTSAATEAGATAGAAAGTAAAAAESGVAAAGAAEGGAAAAGAGAAGAEGALASIGPVGWVGLAALAAYSIFGGGDGPESDTRLTFASNNDPGNISINERGNEGQSTNPYIGGYGTSSFGTFGVSSSFWSDTNSSEVQALIKNVSTTDDALASLLTTSEKADVTAALSDHTDSVHLGAEGTDQNASGQLDAVFADRITTILNAVDPALGQLEAGFSGTSEQLATEAEALLTYRNSLKDSGQAIFGTQVTLEDIAALKAPTEATSVALNRVTEEFTATNQVASFLGKDAASAFGAVGLASEGARAQLILLAGGADTLNSQAASFASDYLTDAQKLAPETKAVSDAMDALGLSSVTTKDQFKDVVDSLDLSTAAGEQEFESLMQLESAFAQTHPDELSDQLDLQSQIFAATGDAAGAAAILEQQHQLALEALSPAMAALTKQLYAAQAAADVLSKSDDLVTAYKSEASAQQDVIDKLTQFQDTVLNLKESLDTGDLSSLSPEQKLAETKQTYESTLSLANSGDATAQGQLSAAAQAYLTADKAYNGSTQAYANDAAKVQSDLTALAASTGKQISADQAQLDAMTDEVGQLVDLNTTTDQVLQAILDLTTALKASATAANDLTPGSGDADTATASTAETGVINSLYESLLGRSVAGDDAGLAFWTNALDSGQTLAQITAGIESSPEYVKLHGSHFNGLANVPFDGYYAELHQGEGVLTAGQNAIWKAMNSSRSVTTAAPVQSAANVATPAAVQRQADMVDQQNKLLDDQNKLLDSINKQLGSSATSADIRKQTQYLGKVMATRPRVAA
jgi:phage-related minor tail protein